MRAITLKNPYASLMLFNKIETRTWNTKIRGEVLLCNSKIAYGIDKVFKISGEKITFDIIDKLRSEPTLRYDGCAIAVGELVDCRPMNPEDEALCFVQYKPGLFCHIYENVRRITPVKIKGSQGFFEAPINLNDLDFSPTYQEAQKWERKEGSNVLS